MRAAMVLLPTLAGCATMISGSYETLRVTSSPPGATVSADPGQYRVVTPGDLRLPRKEAPYRLRCEMPGYEPLQSTVSYETNSVMWANMILGGVIGIIVDVQTGASKKLAPNPVHLTLTPALEPPADGPPE
jgi:hypothetical protein